MPRVVCSKKDCLNNENGECMIFDLAVSEEGLCLDFSPKEYDPDSPDKERV